MGLLVERKRPGHGGRIRGCVMATGVAAALGTGGCRERVEALPPDEGGAVATPTAIAAGDLPAPDPVAADVPSDPSATVAEDLPAPHAVAADVPGDPIVANPSPEATAAKVQPGDQTALRVRKHPFAKFITTIHRPIHENWAWGFLEELDTRQPTHHLNDDDLWTRVEIVLTGDGAIEAVTTVRPSGEPNFDTAAREVVRAAAPFPAPPPAIVSGDGKTYIHWAFHRDERACGTFGVHPFILDVSGAGERPDPSAEVRPTAPSRTEP